MMNSTPIKRGCGYRVEGGVYAEVPLAPGGTPIERFILCEPKTRVANNAGEMAPIEQAWGLSPRGVTLVSLDGNIHVVDIVGSSKIDSYYNASDIIEETRQHGLSRRLELTESDYALLGPGSMILLAHARGSKINASDFALSPPAEKRPCPKTHAHHERSILTGMCAALHYEGLMGGEYAGEYRAMRRKVGDTEYLGFCSPEGVEPDRHEMALIAAFPIHNLSVIKHPDLEAQEKALAKARKTAFSISLDEF